MLPLTGSIYQYTFDSMGRPTGETRTDPSLSPVTLVDQVTYNTFGALTQMRKTIPNQTETRSYDAFQRMTSMTMFDQTVIAYNYASTANDGKIVSQTTTPSGGSAETVNYTYDSLGRLTQAATAGAGGWGLSWMFDGWGNRLQQSAVKGTVPTITTTTDPATNRITAHTYDANGNTTYTPLQGTMTYDALNRLSTVASDTYGYDANNKRIWKNTEFTFWGAGGERIGRYSAVKLVDDASQHVFVFQKVAVDEYFGGRRLTTQDRLGSVGSYYPYGEAKSGTVSNAESFATYYRDSSGLDYADQRYYSSANGRFLSADPSDESIVTPNPNSWNGYTYALNEPIGLSDPTGLTTCSDVIFSPTGQTFGQIIQSTSELGLLSALIAHEAGPKYADESVASFQQEQYLIGAALMNRFDMANGSLTAYGADGQAYTRLYGSGTSLSNIILTGGGNNKDWGIFANGRLTPAAFNDLRPYLNSTVEAGIQIPMAPGSNPPSMNAQCFVIANAISTAYYIKDTVAGGSVRGGGPIVLHWNRTRSLNPKDADLNREMMNFGQVTKRGNYFWGLFSSPPSNSVAPDSSIRGGGVGIPIPGPWGRGAGK